jgi:hypothetical protein
MFFEIVVMQANPTPKARKHIQVKVDKKQCLCCEKPSLKRGLCYQCYYDWSKTRKSLGSATKRAAFDAKLIRAGKLLKEQAIREFKNKSVFDVAAAEIA